MPDRIQNLKDVGLFLRRGLAACRWELLQIIYSQRKAGLTWHGSQEWLQSYVIWGIRASSELNGYKWPAAVMAIVTSQTWLQVSSKHRRKAMGRRQGGCPCWGWGVFCLFHTALFLVEEPWPGTKPASPLGLRHWQEQATTVSLLPAASSMPKLAPALRGPFPLLAGLTQLTSSFGFSKITPLPGNLHLRSSCSYSLLGGISLHTHDPRGTHSCNLLMRIK